MRFINKNNWKPILIIVFLVIIVAGGILWWFAVKQKTIISHAPEIKIQEKTDWLTYKNKEYGYEIKYPPDWKFFEGGQETDSAALSITRFFTKTLINSVIKIRAYQNPSEDYQKILRGEENAPNPRAVERKNDKYYFLISYFGEKEGIEIFEKMVSTFKFTPLEETNH